MSMFHKLSRAARRRYSGWTGFLFLAMASLPAQANDLKSVLERWTGNIKVAGPLMILVFAVLGLGCVGIGLYKFAGARKRQESVAEGLLYCLAGSLLLSLAAVSGVLSGTSFGSNEANDGLNALGID